MARTAVPVTTITPNASNTMPAGTTIVQADGASIPAGDTTRLLIRIRNTNGSDRVATILAGDPALAPRASLGNLAVTVPATSGDVLLVVESARFKQADDSIHVDFAASFAGTISAILLPKNA